MGKSSTRAKDKYNAANYDSTLLRLPKGHLEKVDEAAAKAEMSRQAFILAAINEKMEREGGEG